METPLPTDCGAAVQTMLASSGLSPSPDEAAMISAGYPAFRAAVDALYEVTAARYADPALRFLAVDMARVEFLRQVRDDDHPLVTGGQRPSVLPVARHRGESRGE